MGMVDEPTASGTGATGQLVGAMLPEGGAVAGPIHPEQHNLAQHHPGVMHAVQSLLYGIVVGILIMTFATQPFRIPSASMEPTLMVGDFVLVAKGDFGGHEDGHSMTGLLPAMRIRRGDVIVFRYPVDPSIHLVKRVVGLPGDRLRLHDDQLFVNGQPLIEPYAHYAAGPGDAYRDNFPRLETPDPDVVSNWWIQMRSLVANGELMVPPGEYFVLGDNRNDSEDSRYWGLVPASAIVGRPVLIYFSLAPSGRQADRVDGARPGRESSAQAASGHGLLGAIDGFARWDRVIRVVH